MKVVFLDAKTVGDDIDFGKFEALGEFVRYDYTTAEEIADRVKDANVVITNKCKINAETLGEAPKLQLVCVTATGTDNLDKVYLDALGIGWRNVAGYSTNSVAQVTFSLLFYLLMKMNYYDEYVKSEKYVNDAMFTHFDERFVELNGKTFGIIGLGEIGRKVAAIAEAFGAKVIYCSPSGAAPQPGYTQVDFETLLRESDFVSINAALNEHTLNLIDKAALAKMKPSAILINVGRGPIINEQDLAEALESGQIAAAGLDVLTVEPMTEQNPLRQIKDSRKLVITPHIGWASIEARTRLMDLVHDNIATYFGL